MSIGRRLIRAFARGDVREESVDVAEINGVRSLYLGSDTIQSSMRVRDPLYLELRYSRAMMMFLLFTDAPKTALILGLGGGSIPKFLHHYFLKLHTRVLEINPRVINVARSHFYLPDNDERLQVIETDGILYLQNMSETVDIMMLDAFDANGVPPAMYSEDFFATCAKNLGKQGILLTNLWGSDKNFDVYLQRIESVFEDRVLVLRTGKPGNIVVMAFNFTPNNLGWTTLRSRARSLEQQYNIEFTEFLDKIREDNQHTTHTLLLGGTREI